MKKHIYCSLLISFSVVGCGSIPENGAVLNQKVTEGIERNQAQVENIIAALAQTQRATLEKKWEVIFPLTVKKYMLDKSVSSDNLLTPDQWNDISVNARNVYQGFLDIINDKEETLIYETKENSNTLMEISEEVSRYFLSTKELEIARLNTARKITELDIISIPSFVEIDPAVVSSATGMDLATIRTILGEK